MMYATTTKRYLFAMLALCLSLTAFGQSQTQARKWFVAGEYAKAKPVFAKLVKGNPKSGSLNYWYGVCLNETGEHAKALNMLEKKDSSALSIATEHLAEAVFAVEDVVRNGDKRMVMFTIDAGEGMNKKKTATLRKEEGVWRIEAITDRH